MNAKKFVELSCSLGLLFSAALFLMSTMIFCAQTLEGLFSPDVIWVLISLGGLLFFSDKLERKDTIR